MLEPVDRAPSSHRRYSASDVGWIQFLTRLRSTSLPIARIRDYAELARQGDGSSADRLELLQRHDAAESIRTIHRGIGLGVTFFDTA